MKYTYEELTTKLKNKESVSLSDATPTQVFKLIHDKIIKCVSFQGTTFEMTFLPVDKYNGYSGYTSLNDYPENRHFFNFVALILTNLDAENNVYLNLEDELFIIHIEILETEE
jgi:hypothetical protein